jgi:hypothetical protein
MVTIVVIDVFRLGDTVTNVLIAAAVLQRSEPEAIRRAIGYLNRPDLDTNDIEGVLGTEDRVYRNVARNILARRDEVGGFRNLRDLAAVRGLGVTCLAKLVERLATLPDETSQP